MYTRKCGWKIVSFGRRLRKKREGGVETKVTWQGRRPWEMKGRERKTGGMTGEIGRRTVRVDLRGRHIMIYVFYSCETNWTVDLTGIYFTTRFEHYKMGKEMFDEMWVRVRPWSLRVPESIQDVSPVGELECLTTTGQDSTCGHLVRVSTVLGPLKTTLEPSHFSRSSP